MRYKGLPSKSESESESELELEESIVERTKLRRQRSVEQPQICWDNTDILDLESEESAEQRRNQQGKGLKTNTKPKARLPISLAQLKVGNNSEKLKNEIRQILYSLYRSKKSYKANP